MRWFWQRRRQRQAAVETPPSAPVQASTTTVHRAPTTSGRLGQPRQLADELLLLARDYLQAIGGRVRVEDEDVLSATLPDGSLVRYTSTLAKARADESMTLLVEGSEALAAMLDDIAVRSRRTALRLDGAADPVALALDRCSAPAAKCGECLSSLGTDQSPVALCPTCPLREGRFILRWRAPGTLTARVVRQEPAASVELAYLVAARDRQGRRDEWLRHAVDVSTGKVVPTLTPSLLAAAHSDILPPDYEHLLSMARASTERALGGSLVAVGIFLRQRSLDEYRGRVDEVAMTFDRMRRESPEAGRVAKVGRGRELAALADVYAVDVEAQMESACFVTSPMAEVALRPQKGRGEVVIRVDLGRQYAFPPQCASCGANVQAGDVCEVGHVVCANCAAACSRCGTWWCTLCGEAQGSTCAKCGHSIAQVPAAESELQPAPDDGRFAVRHLEVLPPEMWLAACEWLIARQGIMTDSRRTSGDTVVWQGQTAAGKAIVAALRPRPWSLDEAVIREAAAHLLPDQPATTRMVLSTASATAEALQVAQQFGVRVLDRAALEEFLASLASAHERERERQRAETQALAEGGHAAQEAMLETVDALERALAPLRRSRRTGTQTSAGASGSRMLVEARAAIERASLAWETLVSDWAASFSERPARTGNLVIHGEVGRFDEMIERATHLRAALLDATHRLAEAPARGEAGYAALRQAILEECAARCEAWRWRIRSFEPLAWSDFERAWNAKAATKAAEATTVAGHATARADKAQSQALRAG